MTSPLPVKGCKILASARLSGHLSREGSLLCHTCCDTGPRFFRSHPKDRPIQSPFTTQHTSIILYCIKLGLKRFIEISILFNIICSIQCSILCLNFRFDKSLLNVMQNKSDVIDLHVMFYLQNGQKNIHTIMYIAVEMKMIVNVLQNK